jgi:hypothetical protein
MGKEWDKLGATTLEDPSTVGGFQDGAGGNPFSRSRVRYGSSVESIQAWHADWLHACFRVLVPGGRILAFGGSRVYHRMAAAFDDAGFVDLSVEAWNYATGFPKSHSVGKGIDKRPGVQGHTNFAVHLRARRLAKGLSTSDVAEKIVGSRSGVCRNWERYQFPEARWWPALRDLLDLDPQWGDILAEAKREVVGVNPNVLRAHKSQGGQVTFGGAGGAEVTTPSTDAARTWDGWGTALKPAWEPIIVGRKPE